MEATVIKFKGLLQDSKVMMGGITFLNPTRSNRDGYVFRVVSRIPNVGDGNVYVTLRAFDGKLGGTSTVWTPKKTEVINGSIVRTYTVDVNDNAEPFTFENGTKVYSDRQIRLKADPDFPWRVDILGDNVDVYMGGLGDNDNPLIIDAEQFKYSSIPQSGIVVGVAHNTGAIKTEWFRGNTNLRYIRFRNADVDIQGTVMDFAACPNLEYISFTACKGIKGAMSLYLNALSAAGVKNHMLEVHITESGIIQDVYKKWDEATQTWVYSGVFEVWFDSEGVWHAQARGTGPTN